MVTELFVPRRNIIVPKPKSYIKLDMAFGVGSGTTLFDKSRYRSHSTITGAAWAAGAHGYALDFESADKDYVTIPAAKTQLDFTSEDFSIITRFKPESIGAAAYLFCRSDGANNGYILQLYADGRVGFFTFQSGGNQVSRSAIGSVAAGSWYTIGISRDGSSVKIYVNGVQSILNIGVHTDPATCPESAKIGIHNNLSSFPIDGLMEFLRVFGGIALSTSEHLAYHNALA